jgi:TonB family protein
MKIFNLLRSRMLRSDHNGKGVPSFAQTYWIGPSLVRVLFLSMAAVLIINGCTHNNPLTQRVNGMKFTLLKTFRGQEWGNNNQFAEGLGLTANENNEIFVVQFTMETKKDQFLLESTEVHSVKGARYSNPRYQIVRDMSNLKQQKYTVEFAFEVPTGEVFSKFITGGKEFDLTQLPKFSTNVPLPSSPVESDLKEDETAYLNVEEPSRFQGGTEDTFRDWVQKNLVYTPKVLKKGGAGLLVVKFVVNKKGEVTDVEIMRGVDPSLDKQVISVVKSSPKWKPARTRGQVVNQKICMTLDFRLPEVKD